VQWLENSSLPHVSVFLGAFPFDLLVLIVTIATLRHLRKSSPLRGAIFIIGHLVVVAVLAIGCFTSVRYAMDFSLNHNSWGLRYYRQAEMAGEIALFNQLRGKQITSALAPKLSSNTKVVSYENCNTFIDDLKQSPVVLCNLIRGLPAPSMNKWITVFRDGDREFKWTHDEESFTSWPSIFLTGTVTVPVLLFMVFLLFMLVARFLLFLCMYFFEKATETSVREFLPGTLFCAALSILIAIAKCGAELFAILRPMIGI
jgi:hypothetical protein